VYRGAGASRLQVRQLLVLNSRTGLFGREDISQPDGRVKLFKDNEWRVPLKSGAANPFWEFPVFDSITGSPARNEAHAQDEVMQQGPIMPEKPNEIDERRHGRCKNIEEKRMPGADHKIDGTAFHRSHTQSE